MEELGPHFFLKVTPQPRSASLSAVYNDANNSSATSDCLYGALPSDRGLNLRGKINLSLCFLHHVYGQSNAKSHGCTGAGDGGAGITASVGEEEAEFGDSGHVHTVLMQGR